MEVNTAEMQLAYSVDVVHVTDLAEDNFNIQFNSQISRRGKFLHNTEQVKWNVIKQITIMDAI